MMKFHFVIAVMLIVMKDIRIDSLTVSVKSDNLIIYGTSVELQCLSDNTSSQSSWYWFSENNLLFIDGHGEQNINKSKFIEQQINDVTRQLTILHFAETDFKMYKCKHDLKSASIDLTLQRYRLTYLNNSSKLQIRLERQGYDDQIVISFMNTSSTPSCYYQSLNATVSITQCKSTESGFLLNGMCQIVMNKSKTCESQKSNVEVMCYLGNKLSKTFEFSACHIQNVAVVQEIALISAVCSVLGVSMLIFIFIIIYKKKLSKGRDEDPCKNCQKDSGYSTDVTSKFLQNEPE
ncbi:uncharacterized protein LOC127717591 [Mytilus californianus]|uniref:uncharacterized protein LOC127717591 n=1 Tax=Mytilus californianus TaxID=6549 RepID=UPI0022473036|nr:uncharacterized protein LOC127717591 [Mytilus californianus]